MSKVTFKLDKKANFSEWYSRILSLAEIVDIRYGLKGFVVYRPYGFRMLRTITRFFEEELERRGHEPALFPVLIPERNFAKEAEHIKGFAEQVFWVTRAGSRELAEKACLRPTSETAIYPMYALWISSYRDLPLKMYQSTTVYRYETKATRPLIRAREFPWIETHDVFSSLEECEQQVREDIEVARRVTWEKLGIPFVVLERPWWDKFPGAERTFAFETLMPDGRALQISTTHLLGQKFSKVFEVKFKDEKEQDQYAWQTCFGIGLSRILAALIATHGDDGGLVLPFSVAPIQVVLIPIFYNDEEKKVVLEKSGKAMEELKKHGIRAYMDLSEQTPGAKFYFWEMKGVPIRIEIGLKEVSEGFVTVFRRDLKQRTRVRDEELIRSIFRIADEMLEELKRRAKENFERRILHVKSKEELYEKAGRGYFFVFDFCGELSCAEKLSEETGLEIRGRRIDVEEEPEGSCILCGKEAKYKAYAAIPY